MLALQGKKDVIRNSMAGNANAARGRLKDDEGSIKFWQREMPSSRRLWPNCRYLQRPPCLPTTPPLPSSFPKPRIRREAMFDPASILKLLPAVGPIAAALPEFKRVYDQILLTFCSADQATLKAAYAD
jgi:hypothetical protein